MNPPPSFERLGSPGRIGRVELRNRTVFAPIDTNLGTDDGFVTERLARHYERRARGGAGLVIVEICIVNEGGAAPHQVRISDDRFVAGIAGVVGRVQAAGARCFLQLGHLGGEISARFTGRQAVAPSAIPSTLGREMPRELDHAGIAEAIGQYAAAARRAVASGCDGIEIHAGHGYLISQFLSPVTNLRTDDYGGSATNRYRFLHELMLAVRASVGPQFPVIVRISADEKLPGGLQIEDSIEIARRLEQDGADAIDVSAGRYGSLEWTMPPMAFPRGLLVPYAAAIRKAVGVPVIAVGRISDPFLAERVLADGQADFVALGRPMLADPDYPNKALAGRVDDIRACPACNDCLSLTFVEMAPIGCMVNPEVGHDGEIDYSPAATPRRVLVIGGGPGGMEAARIAQSRGHRVTLVEARDRLGGHLLTGGQVSTKADLKVVLAHMVRQLGKSGVEVLLDTRVDRAWVERMKPDVVVVATGSRPAPAGIVGADLPHVLGADEVLEGRPVAGNAVVLGASGTGCEVAERLAAQGAASVTIVARGKRYARSIEPLMRRIVRQHLDDHGVRIMLSTDVVRIEPDRVICRGDDGAESDLPADAVVIARGYVPDDTLRRSLDGGPWALHALGDCVEVRRIRIAVREAHEVAAAI